MQNQHTSNSQLPLPLTTASNNESTSDLSLPPTSTNSVASIRTSEAPSNLSSVSLSSQTSQVNNIQIPWPNHTPTDIGTNYQILPPYPYSPVVSKPVPIRYYVDANLPVNPKANFSINYKNDTDSSGDCTPALNSFSNFTSQETDHMRRNTPPPPTQVTINTSNHPILISQQQQQQPQQRQYPQQVQYSQVFEYQPSQSYSSQISIPVLYTPTSLQQWQYDVSLPAPPPPPPPPPSQQQQNGQSLPSCPIIPVVFPDEAEEPISEKSCLINVGGSEMPKIVFGSPTWTEKEDQLLDNLVSVHRLKWKDIAEYFPTRTANACQFRWRRKQNREENLRKRKLRRKQLHERLTLNRFTGNIRHQQDQHHQYHQKPQHFQDNS